MIRRKYTMNGIDIIIIPVPLIIVRAVSLARLSPFLQWSSERVTVDRTSSKRKEKEMEKE